MRRPLKKTFAAPAVHYKGVAGRARRDQAPANRPSGAQGREALPQAAERSRQPAIAALVSTDAPAKESARKAAPAKDPD